MIKLNKIARSLGVVLVAAQLSMAGVVAGTIVATAPASAAVIGVHGSWKGVNMEVDGRRLVGVQTHMSNGGIAAILVDGNKIVLVLIDDNWRLKAGLDSDIVVSVDGHKFTGHGSAASRTMIVATNIEANFVKALMAGDEALFDIGGVRWNLKLDGFTASFTDALNSIGA